MTYLGTIRVCGLTLAVQRGDESDHASLERAYACYDLDTMVIWIHEKCPENAFHFWLTHEAWHAVMSASGAFRASAAAFGLDADDVRDRKKLDEWEEVMIRILTPHVIETFGPAKVSP